ncbi:placenta-specific gene 8 protein-like [Synchiropus splendidus]|uniref:placenta-specific gene 8 protein-like n=1 Tax=Synchiropus splendidus TaxID=270530 RepID=UPI00237D3655|nr:placenta-specific gene 8 protein-like [Synchiropus splendidus]XP_053715938.1 placenta-specific gene 8 protein-like [Synchiropus splendidus]XP_053715939.1 placenta-specific gene 8 protein-like [Synchiropus splendidus]
MSSLVVTAQPKKRGPLSGTWTTGLCDCHKDLGDCCCALCCLPVFTCQVSRAGGMCPLLPLLDIIGCVPPASLAMRATIRERYGIQGSVWSDCFFGCCCYHLSWMQISRELKRRAASHADSSSSVRYTSLVSLEGAHLV